AAGIRPARGHTPMATGMRRRRRRGLRRGDGKEGSRRRADVGPEMERAHRRGEAMERRRAMEAAGEAPRPGGSWRGRGAGQEVDEWLRAWGAHAQNRMATRVYELCTELTLAGELFVAFHLNPFDHMPYLRPIPAAEIDAVETDPEDVETERRFRRVIADR